MNTSDSKSTARSGRKWLILLLMLSLAGFMYVSIMYKIINFGA